MLNLEEFRPGNISLPINDAADVPFGCVSCHYLFGKEFSVGEGFTYLCCGCLSTEKQVDDPSPEMHD